MPDEDLVRIAFGPLDLGIIGLKAAIQEVKPMQGRPDEEIAQALLERLSGRNYIPPSKVADYKKVFLREFKKALDEKVEEERGGLHIKILGPGCPCSQDFVALALTALSELGLPADVQHITDMQEIAQWGVTGTPALIINGKVKAIGRMPSKETLKQWLAEIDQVK